MLADQNWCANMASPSSASAPAADEPATSSVHGMSAAPTPSAHLRAPSRAAVCDGYVRSQAITHTKPAAPVVKNTQHQPHAAVIAASTGSATTAPRLEPVLNSPNANERSRGEKCSATALAAPGKPPP